ncbi:hypothetical protein V6N13_084477 [Hibiscus sabdariffa]
MGTGPVLSHQKPVGFFIEPLKLRHLFTIYTKQFDRTAEEGNRDRIMLFRPLRNPFDWKHRSSLLGLSRIGGRVYN